MIRELAVREIAKIEMAFGKRYVGTQAAYLADDLARWDAERVKHASAHLEHTWDRAGLPLLAHWIKAASGWQWLTVPVLHRFPQRISEVRVNHRAAWPRKHLQALLSSYSGTPFFEVHRPFFEEVYAREWARLADLNLATLRYLAEALGIRPKLLLASSLPARQGRTERLVAICRALGADTYLSGAGARGYLDLG